MKKLILLHVLLALLLCGACTPKEPVAETVLNHLPSIFPDYTDVTLPTSIAPLRFRLTEAAEEAVAVLTCGSEKMITSASQSKFLFAEKEWKKLIEMAGGKDVEVTIYRKDAGKWSVYPPFLWHVATEPMDGYLVYRLIEPGYVLWNRMGIYQRDLSSFQQSPIIENGRTDHNCMNCHSFQQQNPDKMLFHMRAQLSGTYIIKDQKVEKLDTNAGGKVKSLVYPSWHPTHSLVAFSVNSTMQGFHMNDKNRIEVFDQASDVVIYDIDKHEVLTDSLLFSTKAFETFPTFSPDGKTLYFCSATARKMPDEFKSVKYNLCAISFDPDSRHFGNRVDTLYHSATEGKSVSFPRVSPDGRFLIYTLAEYGNFSIWHKDADLYLLDLQQGSTRRMDEANSPDVESYHSWSSNGRWLAFSSRRMDGLYTRPYLMYIGRDGKAGKPFVLPQKDPDFYADCMQSYNLPEFVKGEVDLDAHSISRSARGEGNRIKMAQ